MHNFSFDQSQNLEATHELSAETQFQAQRFIQADANLDSGRWISASTLILALIPLGIWCWWTLFSAIISLF